MNSHRDKVAVVGVGFSRVARSSGMTVTGLAIESCINALRDAGLKADDITATVLAALGRETESDAGKAPAHA